MLRPRILLVLLYAVLCSVVTVWVLLDRRPPEWDHANHLERAVDFHRSLRIVADTGTREILEASSLYLPFVICAAVLSTSSFPAPPHRTGRDDGFLRLGDGLYGLGRRLADTEISPLGRVPSWNRTLHRLLARQLPARRPPGRYGGALALHSRRASRRRAGRSVWASSSAWAC